VKVTNLKRNSSLTAVERCKNPNLQKRLGFSFCTFQVLKWRSGLTRVVSTYTYAVPLSTTSVPTPSKHCHPVTTITRKNTTQCPEVVSTYTYAVLLSAISTPYPLQTTWEAIEGGFNPHICRPPSSSEYTPLGCWGTWTVGGGDLAETRCDDHNLELGHAIEPVDPTPTVQGTDTPSHTLGSIPSEHGAFAWGKAAQSCATHGEANRWGSRIYGELVSTSHVVPKPQSLSFALTAHSPWTMCLWGGEQPTGSCWCNVVSSVILILYRQPRWLYTITQIVCQVQSETMIAHLQYELSGHSVGGCDRLCSRLRNRR
jgi:hypothetical protein